MCQNMARASRTRPEDCQPAGKRGGVKVDKLDVAGVLRAYSEQVANNGSNTKKLRDLIRRLKAELDLRKIYQKED